MNPIRVGACALVLGLSAVGGPATASEQLYTYVVTHPLYGEIGTFTDNISRFDGVTRIDTRLRIAVRLLGIVAYREDADGTEVLRGNQLISLHNLINKDGERSAVVGQVQGEKFIVNSPLGTNAAPGTVAPSDPWLLKGTGRVTVVSTRTGRIVDVTVSGGEAVTIEIEGVPLRVRHFIVTGDKRQDIWLDDNHVPVMFRSMEDGTPIDFVLKEPLPQAVASRLAAEQSMSEIGARGK